MNNDIQKILDRLERIDHKEYKTAFEFADSATFDEMARCFKERMIMADYITNLEQNQFNKKYFNVELRCVQLEKENKRLKEELTLMVKDDEESQKAIIRQAEKINKAIEYIKNNKKKLYQGRNDFTCEIQYSDEVVKADELLDILQGEDKDE